MKSIIIIAHQVSIKRAEFEKDKHSIKWVDFVLHELLILFYKMDSVD